MTRKRSGGVTKKRGKKAGGLGGGLTERRLAEKHASSCLAPSLPVGVAEWRQGAGHRERVGVLGFEVQRGNRTWRIRQREFYGDM